MASWIMVSSRCVAGLSMGMRAFSASSTMVNATPVNARLGDSVSAWVARRSDMTGSAVVMEISEATKITISSAGSARNPTIISRRAPMLPKAVPMSIAASDMNTRAVANSPTSAMASAAVPNGSRVLTEGMMAAATTIVPNTMYGVKMNRREAGSATAASLWNSLRIPRYTSSTLGARRFCSHARHWFTQPRNSGAAASAAATARNWVNHSMVIMACRPSWLAGSHRTSANSTISVMKPYSRYDAMRPCCSAAKASAMRCTSAPSGAYAAFQMRSPITTR